jgi:TonB family protein
MSKLERPAVLPLLAALTLAGAPAHADWRCDCTRITGRCEAGVALSGDSVQITSDQRACSRVEYYVDGQPFVALVVDGERRETWGASAGAGEVLVQSCQLCADQLEAGDGGASMTNEPEAGATTSQGAAPAASSPDTPLIEVAPAWPVGTQARSGEVTVELNVSADGVVTQARVLESKPRGVFDQAALDAVKRWRYAPGEARTLKTRVPFEAPAAASAAAVQGPRNACVREGNVDDLVDIVQVQLINACADALLVRTCAVGFAERAQQWVCDGQPLALVARGDALNGLLGETTTERGRVRFGYTDESYLSRPAGSRYALIACAVDDEGCNGAALRWTEYLNTKPSDVDPSAGSEVAVAVAR